VNILKKIVTKSYMKKKCENKALKIYKKLAKMTIENDESL